MILHSCHSRTHGNKKKYINNDIKKKACYKVECRLIVLSLERQFHSIIIRVNIVVFKYEIVLKMSATYSNHLDIAIDTVTIIQH